MLLAIDVGNTNIVIGVFRGQALVHTWRLTTIRERTSDELGILVWNLSRERQHVKKGERCAQMLVIPIAQIASTAASSAQSRCPKSRRSMNVTCYSPATGAPCAYGSL